jgi:hypothetical protein
MKVFELLVRNSRVATGRPRQLLEGLAKNRRAEPLSFVHWSRISCRSLPDVHPNANATDGSV